MTSAQDKLYWRLWGAAAKSNGWRVAKGRLESDPDNAHRSTDHGTVWSIAGELAAQAHHAITLTDLRHACSHIASSPSSLGSISSHKSHLSLNNPQLDRLYTLLRLLADPDDLDARLKHDNPAIGERERLAKRIAAAAPHAYIDRICRDRFEDYTPPFWEDLPLNHLKILHHTLRERTQDWTRPLNASPPSDPSAMSTVSAMSSSSEDPV